MKSLLLALAIVTFSTSTVFAYDLFCTARIKNAPYGSTPKTQFFQVAPEIISYSQNALGTGTGYSTTQSDDPYTKLRLNSSAIHSSRGAQIILGGEVHGKAMQVILKVVSNNIGYRVTMTDFQTQKVASYTHASSNDDYTALILDTNRGIKTELTCMLR